MLSELNIDGGPLLANFDVGYLAGNVNGVYGTSQGNAGFFQSPYVTKLTTATGDHKTVKCRKNALSHVIVIEGVFRLSYLAATLLEEGDR